MVKLILQQIKKSFGDKKVLKSVNFTFEQGKIYGLLGRNGSGKTTLFNCINEDIDLDEGEFFLEDNGVRRPVTADDLGYVLSTPVVPEFLTAREFLKFYIDINKTRLKHSTDPDFYFDLVRIVEEDRDRLMKDYSHGMKNKMQMLIYIISRPPILLLDEPLTSFDVVVADEMKKLLRSIKSEQILIFSTHIMELALDLCDEIVLLNNGLLTEVPKEHLTNDELKENIIQALRGEEL